MASDEPANPGDVREDIPLRPADSMNFSENFGGIKSIVGSFVIISIAVTIALATQIYHGDYEIVPHGSVATDSQGCSRIGTDALKKGGNAIDAAIAAAFCLAIVNPHLTGLDATGTMMIYDYRQSRAVGNVPPPPIIVDFSRDSMSNTPQLIKGLAFLHKKFSNLEWNELITPAIELARRGFPAPGTLFTAIQAVGNPNLFNKIEAGSVISLPILAKYLETIANTSTNRFIPQVSVSKISMTVATSFDLDDFTVYMPNRPFTNNIMKFLNNTYNTIGSNDKFNTADLLFRTAFNLKSSMENIKSDPTSTIAVIDKNDVYVSLVTGLHSLFGSHNFANGGYILNDEPDVTDENPNKFMPFIITSKKTCGQRIVLSCGETTGAAQVVGELLTGDNKKDHLASSLESPRLRILNNLNIAYEKNHSPRFSAEMLQTLSSISPLIEAPEPYPTCNAVQQIGDQLSSHADSRGGGLASRF